MKQPRRQILGSISAEDILCSLRAQQQRILLGIKSRPAESMVAGAKARAEKKGLPFDLDEHVAQIQVRLDAGVCELTGIPFKQGDGPAQYDSPSIDRIQPALGYVYPNIRIICHGLNCALGNWGEAALFNMVGRLLERSSGRKLARACGKKTCKFPKFESREAWHNNLALNVLGLAADTVSAGEKSSATEADGENYSDAA